MYVAVNLGCLGQVTALKCVCAEERASIGQAEFVKAHRNLLGFVVQVDHVACRQGSRRRTCTTSDTSGKSSPRAITSLANMTAVGLLPNAAAAVSRCFWLSLLCRS